MTTLPDRTFSEGEATDEQGQIVGKPSKIASRELAGFLSTDGRLLLPFVKFPERGDTASDAVTDSWASRRWTPSSGYGAYADIWTTS